MSNPIYGLACPGNVAMISANSLSPKQRKCGCQLASSRTTKYAPIDYNNQKKPTKYGATVFDSVTGKIFKTQAHIENLTNGEKTATDEHGKFYIPARPSDMLRITHVGYGSIEIVASDLTDKVVLNEQSEELDEVTVGAKKKSYNSGLALLGLVTVFGLVYASADDQKSAS